MEQSPFTVANIHSARQEIPRLLWNRMAYYRVYRHPSLYHILSHMNPFRTLMFYILKIHVDSYVQTEQ